MPLLFIDASRPLPAVGVLRDGAWLAFTIAQAGPVEALFPSVGRVLADAGTSLPQLSGYIFAEGPGSVLGLRTAAMALRAWSRTPGLAPHPIFAVNSLALAAALAAAEHPELARAPFTVFAASRRDRWNAYSTGDTAWAECDAAALAARPGPFLRLPARDFATCPVTPRDFDPAPALARHPGVFTAPGLLHSTDTPDAANPANTYVTWAGDRHRA